MIAGDENGRKLAQELLYSSGNVVDYGDDVGASNVVRAIYIGYLGLEL